MLDQVRGFGLLTKYRIKDIVYEGQYKMRFLIPRTVSGIPSNVRIDITYNLGLDLYDVDVFVFRGADFDKTTIKEIYFDQLPDIFEDAYKKRATRADIEARYPRPPRTSKPGWVAWAEGTSSDLMEQRNRIFSRYGTREDYESALKQMLNLKFGKAKMPILIYHILEDANYHDVNRVLVATRRIDMKEYDEKSSGEFEEYKRLGGRSYTLLD